MFVLVLLSLVVPLFAATNEVLVGGTAHTPAPRGRLEPATAGNGDQFFVAWIDGRSGLQAIVGTRVTREGQVLDPLGIRLPSTTTSLTHLLQAPQVAWDGGAWLVVWTAMPWNDGSSGEPSVYAARVDTNGHLVMAPRVIVERAMAFGVASNGTVSVVISQQYLGPAVRTLVLERNGVPVAQETLPIVQAYRSGFTIAPAGSGFVAAWSASTSNNSRFDRIQAIPLDAGGRIDGAVVDIGNGIAPSVASSGTRVMFAWHRFTAIFPGGGHVLQTRALDMELSNAGEEQTLGTASIFGPPDVVWHEDHFAVVTRHRENEHYFTPTEVRAIELDEDGQATGARTLGAADQYWLGTAAATNGAEMLVAAIGPVLGRTPTAHVVARVVRGQDVSAPVLLTWSGNEHRSPSLASSPAGHIVAWTEDEGVYATRLDANGNSLDGRGVRFSTSAGRALAAFNGTHYVVAWQHGDRIGVRWISPLSGLTVAAAEVPLVEQPGDPDFAELELALATSPQATWVVFAQDRVRVTRIPHTTYMPDAAPVAVSPEEMLVDHPAAAWNGSTLLVVWNEWHVPPRVNPPFPVSFRVLAARLSGGLTLLDPAPLLVAGNDAEDNEAAFGAPSVASNGADWLVVAHQGFYYDVEVAGRRVLQNGTVEGSTATPLALGNSPAVAWNGEHYVLAWKRDPETEYLARLYTAAVPATGALTATKRTLVTTGTAPSVPSLTATAIAYTKYSFRPEHTGVERTFLSSIELDGKRGRVVRR